MADASMAPVHHMFEGSPSIGVLDVVVGSVPVVDIHGLERVISVILGGWEVVGAFAAAGSRAR